MQKNFCFNFFWFCLSFENFFCFNFFGELWTGGYKSGLQVDECLQFIELRAPAKKEKRRRRKRKEEKEEKEEGSGFDDDDDGDGGQR